MHPAAYSLNALRAFEATARRKSMTLAARELRVTHGAISRQVRSLETAMGVMLLARGARSSEPTAEGTHLAEGLTAAFSLVYSTIERVRPGPLTLSCSSSIAMCWLIPRMSNFYQSNPGVEMKLDLNYDKVDFAREKVSVAIRQSTVKPPREAQIRDLGTEWIGPVCSPSYLDSLRPKTPADLSRCVLLTTQTRPNAWKDWFDAFGAAQTAVEASRSFDHFYLMIQAAACGLGIGVVPHILAINELQSGRLVAPFGFVPGANKLSLWVATYLGSRKEVTALEQWLLKEMRSQIPAVKDVRPN